MPASNRKYINEPKVKRNEIDLPRPVSIGSTVYTTNQNAFNRQFSFKEGEML
jgi:hypothetical protein